MQPDRLAELQRQRELVRSHLAWLEQEIAAASGGAGHLQSPTPVPVALDSSAPSTVSPAPFASASPDPIGSAADAKRGCLVLFVIAIALGALALIAIYFLRYSGRPLW